MLTAALPSEMAAVPQPLTRHQNIMGQN